MPCIHKNFIHAASDSIPFHWHDELQITWISEGELEYCINGDKFKLGSDKLVLVQEPPAPQFPHHHQRRKNPVHQLYPEIFHPLILKKYILPMLDSHAFAYSLLLLNPIR